MKILFDFFPIILFFIAFKLGDIYIATGTMIAATGLQVLVSRLVLGHFTRLPLITFATVAVLGGATLFFRNDLFIKWKPTVVYWVLGAVFLGSQYWGARKPLIQRLGEKTLSLPQALWQRLNLSWAIFCFLLGILNLWVAYYFETPIWVHFKLFGLFTLTLIFIIVQGLYVANHSRTSGST